MARKNVEILSDIAKLHNDIKSLLFCGDIESLRKKYLPFRNEFQSKYPNNQVLSKRVYKTNDFDFNLQQIQDEVTKLLNYLTKNINE